MELFDIFLSYVPYHNIYGYAISENIENGWGHNAITTKSCTLIIITFSNIHKLQIWNLKQGVAQPSSHLIFKSDKVSTQQK